MKITLLKEKDSCYLNVNTCVNVKITLLKEIDSRYLNVNVCV